MKDALGLIGMLLLAAATTASVVSFTLAMIVTGQFGWLLIGWFVLPVTTLVWPALAGVTWAGAFYVIGVIGFALFGWAHGREEAAA